MDANCIFKSSSLVFPRQHVLNEREAEQEALQKHSSFFNYVENRSWLPAAPNTLQTKRFASNFKS